MKIENVYIKEKTICSIIKSFHFLCHLFNSQTVTPNYLLCFCATVIIHYISKPTFLYVSLIKTSPSYNACDIILNNIGAMSPGYLDDQLHFTALLPQFTCSAAEPL